MNPRPILLIVDDNPELLEVYRDILYVDGVETVVLESGRDALDYCKKNSNVQVIISDSNMGEMSGMQLLSHLKSYYQTMPAFYLATGFSELTIEEIQKAGGRDLILKPFDLYEILERIKKDLKY